VALSAERLEEWMASDLSGLDILVIRSTASTSPSTLCLSAAVAIDGRGEKHPLVLLEGATEHSAVVPALIDNPIERGLDLAPPRLFVIDGSKALSKAIERRVGSHTPIQRCQVHKACNINERLPKSLHATVRHTLRQASKLDDADKAERLICNLAKRLEREAPGSASSILEGIDGILTVTRLGLLDELRRSPACTNIIEHMMGTIRRVCRNVKRWCSPAIALRWTAAAMLEAKKGLRRLKAQKQLAALRIAVKAHLRRKPRATAPLLRKSRPCRFTDGSDRFAYSTKRGTFPGSSAVLILKPREHPHVGYDAISNFGQSQMGRVPGRAIRYGDLHVWHVAIVCAAEELEALKAFSVAKNAQEQTGSISSETVRGL
jgi:hypothetical protein